MRFTFSTGVGYFGASSLIISTSEQEVIQQHKPSGWAGDFSAYKFSFLNDQDCHIRINGGTDIFIRGGQGFISEGTDPVITTFVIVEAGITYNYVGAY